MKQFLLLIAIVVLSLNTAADAETRSEYADAGSTNYRGSIDSIDSIDSVTVAKDPPLIVADVSPRFQGGHVEEFVNWAMKQIIYPQFSVDNGIEGVVVISFIIEKDGTLTDVGIVDSPSDTLSQEVVRVVKLSPVWTPGMNDGKSVRMTLNVPINFELKPTEKSGNDDKPRTPSPEVMPTFQGGKWSDFATWMSKNVEYPKWAFDGRIEGKVTVSFVIEKDGTLGDVNIVDSPSDVLSREVLRVIILSPKKWTPGMQDGKNIRVSVHIPVHFKLDRRRAKNASKSYK